MGSADDEWNYKQGCEPIKGDLGLKNNLIDIVVLSILAMKLLALKKIRIPCYLASRLIKMAHAVYMILQQDAKKGFSFPPFECLL